LSSGASVVAVATVIIERVTVLLGRTVAGHNTFVGLLMLPLSWVETIDGEADVLARPIVAGIVIGAGLGSVVGVPISTERNGDRVVSEEHVLGVVVDQVALLF